MLHPIKGRLKKKRKRAGVVDVYIPNYLLSSSYVKCYINLMQLGYEKPQGEEEDHNLNLMGSSDSESVDEDIHNKPFRVSDESPKKLSPKPIVQ
jgi:hypothetical protein